MLDEVDRRLVSALQVSPRANWDSIARALNVPERTTARRLQRLLSEGTVRTTIIYDDLRCGVGLPVHVQVRTDAGGVDPVARELVKRPDVRSVFAVTGDVDVWSELLVQDRGDLHAILMEVGDLPGVRRTSTEVVLRTFTTVAQWHAPLLSVAEVAALRATAVRPACTSPERVILTKTEQGVGDLLKRDARTTLTDIAKRLDISIPTARRSLASLLERELIHLRVEVSPALLGFPVEAQICLTVRPEELQRIGAVLAEQPEVRYCCAVAGAYNVLLEVVVAHEGELYEFLTGTVAGLSDELEFSTTIVTRAYKRGHLPVSAMSVGGNQ